MANSPRNQQTYLLGRDRIESERLDGQHHFLMDLLGNQYIHPSIPKNQIQSIADLGTGTGIWLKEISKTIPTGIPSPDLQGFDISAAQFPPNHQIRVPEREPIPLSVQDILQPSPAEHKGRYDLVHIRLLVAGLKAESYQLVLKNARDLLKPNGYIQWEEVDITTFHTDKPRQIPAVTKICQSVQHAMIKMGMSPFAPQRVYEELCSSEFRNVHRQIYTTRGKEYLHDAAEKWVVRVIRALVVPSMVIAGEAIDEADAKRRVDVLVAEFEKHCQQALPLINFTVVIGQL